MLHNDLEVSDPQDIVNKFADAFAGVYTAVSDVDDFSAIHSNIPSFSIGAIQDGLIVDAMSSLTNNMSAGDDLVPSFLIRDTKFVLSQPLKTIINLAISTSVFPYVWKRARIIPVFKKGNPSQFTNYRPIAILSNFSKVFEQVLHASIYRKIKPYISSQQHGFISGRSTVTNLSSFTQYVGEVVDDRGQVDVVYTDFSKAFDAIDHTILLRKLEAFGFSPTLLKLMFSYLTNRNNYVFYNGYQSYDYFSISGVPQGSNLGPLLFVLFINDLLSSTNNNCLAYADDVKLYARVSSPADAVKLQRAIDFIVSWSKTNKLQLNYEKCFIVRFSRRVNPLIYHYTMGDQSLSTADKVKDLGIMFASDWSFKHHIEATYHQASKTLGFIIRSSKYFNDIAVIRRLYFAFIVSRLEYGSIIWYPIYVSHQLLLERVQRRFLKFISFKLTGEYPMRGTSYSLLLQTHGMESLMTRREVYSANFLYKLIANNIDCPALVSGLKFYVPRLSARYSATFSMGTARTNALVQTPLWHMCSNADNIYSDIFTGDLKQVLFK